MVAGRPGSTASQRTWASSFHRPAAAPHAPRDAPERRIDASLRCGQGTTEASAVVAGAACAPGSPGLTQPHHSGCGGAAPEYATAAAWSPRHARAIVHRQWASEERP